MKTQETYLGRPIEYAYAAYHEAGHVVASWEMGFEVVRVSIIGEKRGKQYWGGFTRHSSPLPMRIMGACEDDCLRTALVLLAGEAAQRRFSPQSVRRAQTKGDRMLLKIAVSPKWIPGVRKVAAELVEKKWPRIEAVAAELLQYGTVAFKKEK